MDAGEMPLTGKAPASNSDDMTLISKTHKMEGENSHRLPLDIYTSTTVHTYIQCTCPVQAGTCMHVHTHIVYFYSVKMWLFHVSLIYFSKIVFCLQTPFVLPTVKGRKKPWCWFYIENYFGGCSVLFSTLSLNNRVFSQKGVQSLARGKELRSSYNSFAS